MKKIITLCILSLLLLAVSFQPMYDILREYWTDNQMEARYAVNHAYQENGFHNVIDTQQITINQHHIEIVEDETGQKAPLTHWDRDENVPPGDIVTIQFLLNGEEISDPDEIWLSNRNRGSRYYSWLDVLTVHDREASEDEIYIVQRLTDDSEPMDDREWKIIRIYEEGAVSEQEVSYAQRSDHHLAVKLINTSGTARMQMGYYSEITKGYPTLFFPLLYPFCTSVIGLILLLISFGLFIKRMRNRS